MKRQDFSRLKKNRPIYFKIGMIVALCAVFFAFNYTTYKEEVHWGCGFPMDEQIVLPRGVSPPPLPAAPRVMNFTEPDEKEEEIIFEDETVMKNDTFDLPLAPKKDPPPVVKMREVNTDVFVVVEQMPRFNGCEDIVGGNKEKKDCANKKMLEYIFEKMPIRNKSPRKKQH